MLKAMCVYGCLMYFTLGMALIIWFAWVEGARAHGRYGRRRVRRQALMMGVFPAAAFVMAMLIV